MNSGTITSLSHSVSSAPACSASFGREPVGTAAGQQFFDESSQTTLSGLELPMPGELAFPLGTSFRAPSPLTPHVRREVMPQQIKCGTRNLTSCYLSLLPHRTPAMQVPTCHLTQETIKPLVTSFNTGIK